MNEICVNRSCSEQYKGPHYVGTDIPAENDPRLNPALEALKKSRGGTCWSCRRYLIYTDGDHSFCEDCWNAMNNHMFQSVFDDEISAECGECGEEYDHKIHSQKQVIGKCINCGGLVEEGNNDSNLHDACAANFIDSLFK